MGFNFLSLIKVGAMIANSIFGDGTIEEDSCDMEGFEEVDLDGDGDTDSIGYDLDGDGTSDAIAVDCDNDGTMDSIAIDEDGDGNIDSVSYDTDGDGVIDEVEVDADGNGEMDTVVRDTDGNGEIDSVQANDSEVSDEELTPQQELGQCQRKIVEIDNKIMSTADQLEREALSRERDYWKYKGDEASEKVLFGGRK